MPTPPISNCGPKYQENTCENLFERTILAIEIERKFIVGELPVTQLQNALLEEIQQGYLIQGPDRTVKIRRNGKLFF